MWFTQSLPGYMGPALAYCATSRTVPGWVPGGVNGFFIDISPSDRSMALGSTQPLVKMNTRNIPGGKGGRCVRLTTSPPSCAECHEVWEPKSPGTLWATPGLLRDSFNFLPFYLDVSVTSCSTCPYRVSQHFFELLSSIFGADSADDGLMKVTSQILGFLHHALSYNYKMQTNKMHISKINVLIFNFLMSYTCFETEGSYSGRRLYKQLWYGTF
jgi:hypothetical protein